MLLHQVCRHGEEKERRTESRAGTCCSAPNWPSIVRVPLPSRFPAESAKLNHRQAIGLVFHHTPRFWHRDNMRKYVQWIQDYFSVCWKLTAEEIMIDKTNPPIEKEYDEAIELTVQLAVQAIVSEEEIWASLGFDKKFGKFPKRPSTSK